MLHFAKRPPLSLFASRAFSTAEATLPFHPMVKKNTMARLIQYFPDAQSAHDVNEKINYCLINEGSTKRNTLFAASVCPDEINHYPNSLNSRLSRIIGRSFYMGGLAGIPFIGKVGYNAFTAHVPDDGNLVILFCPHLGITPDGDFGKYKRQGQSCADSSCGAAIGAFRWLENNDWEPQPDKTA